MVQFFAIKDIGDINFNALVKDLPGRPSWNPFSTQGQYVTAILKSYGTFKGYGIDNALRLSHFLAQGLIETGFLRYKGENLNYSVEGLLKIFPKYFTPEEAKKYARKPEKIANRVYANRMGNGDEASGDGWKYRGRGFFQLTGKNNYTYYGELSGIDLVKKPEILENDLATSVKVAAAYFGKTGLGEHADRNDAAAVSRGVNRGNPASRYKAHGEAERIVWTDKVLNVVRNPDKLTASGVNTHSPSVAAGISLGDRGVLVRDFQEKLALLGYPVGAPDGIFGQNTRRAVLAFQDEYGLDLTGVIDTETADAIEDALEDTRSTRSVEREAAGEDDVKRAGARDIGKANEVGAAGATVGGAGAVAVAEETGVLKKAVDAATKAVLGDDEDEAADDSPPVEDEAASTEAPVDEAAAPVETPASSTDEDVVIEDAAEVPSADEITTGTEVPSSVPTETSPDGTSEPNWVLIAALGAVILIGLFVWSRSRGIVQDKVEDYRDGRYV